MKPRKKRIIRVILSSAGPFLVAFGIFMTAYGRFPGRIKDAPFQNQVATAGLKSTFRRGVAYRHPGVPPMLEVSGDPYEMGLQYGVLLRPEILTALDALGRFLKSQAGQERIPYFLMAAGVKFVAGRMARRLPQRYLDEMRGVADGSGVPFKTVAVVSLLYDIYQDMMACTGVLMRGPHGSIIQGRLNDMAAFGEISRVAAIVRHRPKGLNSFIHMDLPLYMGVETGMSDQGLCCGGETLRIKKADGRGFSHPFLVRMILEEADSLDAIYPFFDRYHQVGADGVVWSDLRHGRGAVVEITPTAWAKRELQGPILWDFNRFYDEALAAQQFPPTNIIGANIDRESIAAVFPQKSEYTVDDAVAFIRNQAGPDGADWAWGGTKFPICNKMTTQMMVFDSASDGFYLAMGSSFASRRTIYHVFSDFSKPPEIFKPAVPVHPLAEKAAEIENSARSNEDMLRALVAFADDHHDDANVQFLVAYKAFRFAKADIFSEFAEKALAGKPDDPEYRLFGGLAAYQRKDLDKAIGLLELARARYPEQDLFKLDALERIWSEKKDTQKAGAYRAAKQTLLDQHGVRRHFLKKLRPLLDALDKKG
jgi:hypothetical protein